MKCSFCDHEIVDDALYCPYCNTPTGNVTEQEEFLYEAFISYRHLPLDRQVAVKIQKAIESYPIPKQIVTDDGRKRLGKCFRDEDELPTSASLSDQIEDALKHSRYLIVVCTKSTNESLWVQREVELFASYRGRDHILIALAEGEPDESFPPLLLTRFEKASDGGIVEVPREPIGADFRDLSRAKFDAEKLRIIASIIGCNYDDLRQRAKSRRNKVLASLASIITAVSVAFGGVSTYQQAQIEKAYREIQIKESEFLATEANELLSQGDRYQAVQVALAGLPLTAESQDRPYVPAAQMALEQSLGVYPGAIDWQSLYSEKDITERYGGDCIAYSDSGLEAYFTKNHLIEIRETITGNLVSTIDLESLLEKPFSSSSISCTTAFLGNTLIAIVNKSIVCVDINDGSLIWKQDFEWLSTDQESFAISPDSSKVAIVDESTWSSERICVYILDANDGTLYKTFEFPGYKYSNSDSSLYNVPSVAFFDDGTHLVFASYGTVHLIDLETETSTQVETTYGNNLSVGYLDGLVLAISEDAFNSFTNRPTCLDVYDRELNLLWSYRQEVEIPYDSSFNLYFHTSEVAGLWNYFMGDDRQLVVAFGKKLLLLDQKTGEQVFSTEFNVPIMSCVIEQARDMRRIFIGLGDGSLMVRIPYESNSGQGGSVGDIELDTDLLQFVDFVEIDGRIICSMVTNNPIKRMVYRFVESSDFLEGTSHNESYGMPSIDHYVWDGDFFAVWNEEAVVFADAATFEPLTRIEMSSLDKLDLEKTFDIETSFDSKGNFYVLGDVKKDEEDSTSRMALYRINYPDGTVDPLFTVATSYVRDFSVIDLDDGSTQALFSGYLGHDECVYLVNPELEGDERLTHCVVLKDCQNVSYVDGHFIVCISDYDTKYTTLKMLDAETGEEVDCDLAQYALTNTSSVKMGIALSEDATKLAVACSDGYLRLFDTKTGLLVWETSQVSPQLRFIQFGESGDLFVQDSFGMCSLVSGITGVVLKTTATALPPINQGFYHKGANRLYLLFTTPGLGGQNGLVLVSMDPEMFGPYSIIYGGINISTDEKLFTYIDDYTKEFCSAHMFTLDELILQGHELVLGHELTDAEKLQYQVADPVTKK